MSRQTDYTPELADLICERIADGQSLRKICEAEGMPGRTTVFGWLDLHEPFRTKYTRARELQAEVMLDKQLEVADDCTEDNAFASRVKIGTYQWVASKLAPKKYGDKLELAGTLNHTHDVDSTSDAELEAIALRGRPAPAEPETGEG
jgi:Bacteriophage Sf6, terminase small subunit-like